MAFGINRSRAIEGRGVPVRLDRVSLTYNAGGVNEVPALRDVSVEIEAGQFVTVVGSNGAGKSSLIQVVSGAVMPSAGRVWFGDEDVTRVPDFRRARYIARVFDNPMTGTCPTLSLEENLALALARGRSRQLVFASSPSRRRLMRERLAWLGLGLEDRLSDPVGLFSAGQRQSVTMVMGALQHPYVLLLDEHLAALDPKTQQRVLDLTIEIASETGATTLMVTHNMTHAIGVGDRLLVMNRGALIGDFAGTEKADLTVADLVNHMARRGGVVSDRMMLAEAV